MQMIFEKTKDSVYLEIIEENTPAQYRITEATKNPELLEEILKTIERNKKRQIKADL